MERLLVVIFILQVFSADHVLSEYQLDRLKLLSEVENGHNLMEHFAEKFDTDTLCQKHSKIYLDERNNLTGWAFRMFDASAKIPDGISFGKKSLMGAFHECLDVETPTVLKWGDGYVEGFKGQYMSVYVAPKRAQKQTRMPIFLPGSQGILEMAGGSENQLGSIDFRVGLCVPSSCSLDEITGGLNELQNGALTVFAFNGVVKDKDVHLDSVDKVFISLCSFILIGILIGTLMEIFLVIQAKMSLNILNNPLTNGQKFFLNFGLYANTKRLLDTTPPKGDHLSCLDGIRFISISWVMLGHILSAEMNIFPLSNMVSFIGVYDRFEFQAVLNAFVSVDSFFLMSGCLVSYLMLKDLDKTNGRINFPLLYLHRYLRITGFYAFLIFFLSTVWRHLAIGPNQFLEQAADECGKTPWVNLLYINNFDLGIEEQGNCLGQTWYLANDMQFFLLAPPIVYITWKWDKIGLLIIAILSAASAAVPAGLTYAYGWGTTPVLPGEDEDPKYSYMEWNYFKPWNRFSPYIIGILLGIFSTTLKANLSKCLRWQICGAGLLLL